MGQRIEVELFVSAHFSTEGQFSSYSVNQFKPSEAVGQYGFNVHLFSTKIVLDVPVDETELRGKAAAAVEKTIADAKAKHTARLTALFRLKNQLLLLEAPDVLRPGHDFVDEALRPPEDEEDIPF